MRRGLIRKADSVVEDEAMQPGDGEIESESWTGIADPKHRRKLQNRINQRESRRRRAAEREPTRDKHTDLDMGSSAVVRFGSRDNWNHIGTASPINSSTQKTQDDLAEGDDAFVRAMLLKRNNGVVPRSIDTNMMPQITSCVADAQRVWHYALIDLLPTLGLTTRDGEPLEMALYRSATIEPVIFYATIGGAATQRFNLTQSMEDTRVFLIAQNKTAQLVRESLANGLLTDAVVFAIMALALQHNQYSLALPPDQRYRGAFESPVKDVGGLDWLGKIHFAPEHSAMWTSIMQNRSAVENPLPGIADYLQLADLYRACLTLSPPQLKLTASATCNEDHPSLRGLYETNMYQSQPNLREILPEMRFCCHLIDQLSPGDDYGHFIRHRNFVQYQLLRLPDDQDTLARLAAMVFSYGVLLPISDPRPLRQITKQLCFGMLDPGLVAAQSAHFLLWAAVIGGISAQGEEFQGVFTTLVAKYAGIIEVFLWEDVVPLLEQFVWLGSACDVGGRAVWGQSLDMMEY